MRRKVGRVEKMVERLRFESEGELDTINPT